MLARTWFGLDFSFKVLAGQKWHVITCRIGDFADSDKQAVCKIGLVRITSIMRRLLDIALKTWYTSSARLIHYPKNHWVRRVIESNH